MSTIITLRHVTKSTSKTSYRRLKTLLKQTQDKRKECCQSKEFIQTFLSLISQIHSDTDDNDNPTQRRVNEFLLPLDLELQSSFIDSLIKTDGGLVAISYIIQFFIKKYNCLTLPQNEEFKKEVLNEYIRQYIQCKETPSSWIISHLSKTLLSEVVELKDFQTILFPAFQKGMLRSPEVTTHRMALTLSGLSVDLSPFAKEFGKMLSSSLRSQDEKTRDDATFASRVLSSKISDETSLSELVNWYFSVLGGSEGKLNVAAHKISILKAVGEMIVTSTKDSSGLCNWIQDTCVKAIESEVHEGTLVEYFRVMSKWSQAIQTSCVSSGLMTYLPKGLLNLKSPPVRLSFTCLLVNLFFHKNSNSFSSIQNHIQKSFDKALSQITQGSNLSECITLGLILCNSSPSDSFLANTRLTLSYVDRKFVDSSSSEVIGFVANLAELILGLEPDKDNGSLVHALALTLTVSDFEARKEPKAVVERLLKQCTLIEFNVLLIRSIGKIIHEISDNVKREVLRFLSDKFGNCVNNEDLEIVGIELISLSASIQSPKYYWLNLAKRMQLSPDSLVRKYWKTKLVKYLGISEDVNHASIVELLCLVGGEDVVESVVKSFKDNIKSLDLTKVTREDYFIFHTPQGQLYDNSVLESIDAEILRNVKRESKAYSYKDQLEEINLRKELERKRKEAGKEPKLTMKQKELVKAQLEKEEVIRRNIRQMDECLNHSFLLLTSGLRGNVTAFGFSLKDVLDNIIDLMKNPLSAPYAVNFYLELGLALFKFNTPAGEIITNGSLRFFSPECDLNHEWRTLAVDRLIPILLDKLHYVVVAKGFISPCYSFVYPLFHRVVHTKNFQSMQLHILDITLSLLRKRRDGIDFSPEFIPRRELTRLLYHIIGTSEHRLQQSGVTTLLELAKSCADPFGPSPDSVELQIHLDGIRSHLFICRDTALRCLIYAYPSVDKLSLTDAQMIQGSILQLCFDPLQEISLLASKNWEERNLQKDFVLHEILITGIVNPCSEVRVAGAKALGDLMESFPQNAEVVMRLLIANYENYLVMTPPVFDDFGRLVEDGIDNWEGRHGVGLSVRQLSKILTPKLAEGTMTWILSVAFLDKNSNVHMAMLDAALEIIQIHGKVCMGHFASLIECHLDQKGDTAHTDRVRQSCVVLMGCLARHIDPTDPRVKSIFSRLIDTLSTPSEKVQEAVAHCIPALVPAVADESELIVKGLLTRLTQGEKYGDRRGAAFGLAGVIKGLGILALRNYDIMRVLADGMQDKKNFKRREGSIMGMELLCDFLGRLFEPYIVHVLPYLLQCLGDSNQYVREATEHAARTVMSRLSSHGVKLVLPALISALNGDSWRTKCGSVDLLGRMAYCAPKQLSACLPMIVPRLIEVLGDSHIKVQESGAKALSLIGSVIRNPEIQSVVPVLLGALQDPAKKTNQCLQVLLRTEFVHVVDSPSLALIMPVVERAFQDRSTENRRMACQIIGNMYSLTDHSDLAPYMKNVMPGIRASLLDPVPEVRAVAAKALGSMTRGLGEECYDDLLPWLMKTLVSESNSVDRSGAAQGLAEVIGALGVDKLEKFMPEIIRKADSDDLPPYVRDGYMMMFIYMPSVFEDEFLPFIGQIINPILKALADENEFVRETALRAGQRIVNGYADTAILLLLPELRKGIFDDNWRIRYSSIQLLGDLLYKISGVSGKMSTESAGDDDNFGTEGSQTKIIDKLGPELRNQILAGLYMGRSDVALMVRQSALHVWKVIVANTPKTLREILPTIFGLILNFLSSSSHDKRQVAARTLGDLVRKLGEKILPEIIPILEKGLESPSPEERQGVCIGLSEIMASTSREMVLAFVENLVPTLRRALCDPMMGVRGAAAQTFGSLHATVGSRALDEILPYMMKKLNDKDEGDWALDGLGQILQLKSKAVMPYLIPQLIAPPPNTRALASLASVAGESLSKQLHKIFPVLITRLKEVEDMPIFDDELVNSENVLLSVEDELGVRLVIEELLDCCKNLGNRKAGIRLLSCFVAKTKADLQPHIGTLLRALILLMVNDDPVIINATAEAVPSIIKHVDRENQIDHVEDIRQAIRFARSDLKSKTELPGFVSPKTVKALLSIFREAILNGSPEMKEQAANGMSELISLATAEAIKPSVIHVTGPLIRILGDRYNPEVKVAVLETLTLLLPKVGVNLRAFLPQLQTTFQKAINDENRNVKSKAELAMTQLVYVQGSKN